jgi:hypothetical protein
MRKYLCLLLSLTLFGACEQKTDVVAPASPAEKKTETDTTLVAESPSGRTNLSLPSLVQSVIRLPRPRPQSQVEKSKEIPTEETLTPANIAFNTPESMAYGDTTSVHLVLDLTKSGPELEAMIRPEGPAESQQVAISHIVVARLTGDGFDITPVSDAEQFVLAKTVTRWTWDVRPKRFSTQVLHLSLSNKLTVQGMERVRFVPVFQRNIAVRINSLGSAFSAAKDNWPIVTAAAAPLAGLLGWLAKLIHKRRAANAVK